MLALLLILTGTGCRNGKNPEIEFPDDSESAAADTDIDLIRNGKSDYTIVFPENFTESEEYAGEELAAYIYQSTSCRIPTVQDGDRNFNEGAKILSVGNTSVLRESGVVIDPKALNTDGFVVKRLGNTVIMAGGSDNGTVYAVYEFLRQNFGYEFYAINETYCERKTDVKLKDLDITEIPDFRERTSYYRVVTDSKSGNLRLRVGKGNEWGLFAHSAFTLIPPETYKSEHRDWFSGWEHPETSTKKRKCSYASPMRK
ncbi:MAG: hypothetical protein ACLS4Z_05570 [Christensenellaceae bacterium]